MACCFASDSKAPHTAAWREFNRRISAGGAVGAWHETYAVTPGHQEAIYVLASWDRSAKNSAAGMGLPSFPSGEGASGTSRSVAGACSHSAIT